MPVTRTLPAPEGGRQLTADVYGPAPGSGLRSAVVLLHGGGWRVGSRLQMAPYATELARAGFVAIAPEYRLLDEAAWPAQLDDVKAAIRWVRSRADEMDIAPERIALQGFSAGGHLALLAAATADSPPSACAVAAVVSLFAPVAFSAGSLASHESPAAMLLGEHASPEAARAISPLAHIGPGFPPTFLLQGMDDPLVTPAMTLRLFEALVAAGVKTALHCFHGHTHEFCALPSMLGAVQSEVALFLRRAMVDPAGDAAENRALNPFARCPEGFPPGPAART
jgi:acetyl esterase/lipase